MIADSFKKNYCIKSVVLCAALFFLPFYAMDIVKTAHDKKLVQPTDCGLNISHDIVKNDIAIPYLCFQDMGRLQQVSKACKAYWDIESMCTSAKLQKLPYDGRTVLLSRLAYKKNAQLFASVWDLDHQLRNDDFRDFMLIKHGIKFPTDSLAYKMKKYSKHFCSKKKVHALRIDQLVAGLQPEFKTPNPDRLTLFRKIVSGTNFNIFDSCYRKRCAKRIGGGYYGSASILSTISWHNKCELLFVIIGGSVTPDMFKKVFKHLSEGMVEGLFSMGYIDETNKDKHGRLAEDYWKKK